MTSRMIQRLKDNNNLEGLVRALRHPGDALLRAEAAQALSELNDLEAVEPLIRSTLEDPELEVKKAARSALDDLIGSEAGQAIAAYRSNPDTDAWLLDNAKENEPWLSSAGAASADEGETDEDTFIDHKIASYKSHHNLDGLEKMLRTRDDAALRRKSAQAIGELGDMKASELLIRAFLEDPDPGVQKSARAALDDLIGGQAQQAIDAYRSAPATDEWLVNLEEPDAGDLEDIDWEEVSGKELQELMDETESSEGEEESEELPDVPEGEATDEDSLTGLVHLINSNADLDLKLRAIGRLKRSRNIHAMWQLVNLAAYSEDEDVRYAAWGALKERFGDDTGEIIGGYRLGNLEREFPPLEDEEEEEEDEEGEDEAEEVESPYQQSPSMQNTRQPHVIQEEGLNWRLIFVAILAVLGVVVIILVLNLVR